MYRPTRQYNNLLAKVASKETRSQKPGKRTKRWRKWVEAYKGLAAPQDAPQETAAS